MNDIMKTDKQLAAPSSQTSPSSPRTGKLVILSVVLLLVGLTLIALSRKPVTSKPGQSSSTAAQQQAGEVAMTASGFVPATITVKTGDTVTWTNNDNALHQIASDPYPTEDGLVSFKAENPTAATKTYSFTFTKTGAFAYHDHLNPLKLKGIVIVE